MQMQTRPEEWRARAACGASPCCPRRPSRPRLEPTQARAFRALAAFPVAALPRRLRARARHRAARDARKRRWEHAPQSDSDVVSCWPAAASCLDARFSPVPS